MVIKSLEYPVYQRQRRGGLAGEVRQMRGIPKASYEKTFEDYLSEVFSGEVVQDGNRFSSSLSELTIRNLRKI
jgi:hypothetical protein